MIIIDELPWISEARKHIGLTELPGGKHDPRIVGFWPAIGVTWFNTDEVPWCGAFVGYCLKKAGKPILKPSLVGRALAWLGYGVKIDRPAYGCLAVKKRDGGGHVGFVVGKTTDGHLLILGGNQGNRVSIARYNPSVFEYRWPGIAPKPERYNLPVLQPNGLVLAGSEA